jgi:tRNA threonylcarbamoyladenosine biosynthesis protein TsaB
MSYIINIDTATETAFVSIAKDGVLLNALENTAQKDHGAFVQTAIAALLSEAGIQFNEVDAIAVTAGPGSYTGLRVGMASAKGLSYALNKPLITISTLELWAAAAIRQSSEAGTQLFCSMIDARRMEVFTAVYNHLLSPVMAPVALVLNDLSYLELLDTYKVAFTGNGVTKWQKICTHPNALYIPVAEIPATMAILSNQAFTNQQFADLAYTEPFYLKEFQENI